MGNFNCIECIKRDLNNKNELIISNRYSGEFNQDNSLNSRNERIKINDLEKNNTSNNEENNYLDKKELLRKNKGKNKNDSDININTMNNLKKEERENNILLKNELNKIDNININTIDNNNNIKFNKTNEQNKQKEESINIKNIKNKNNNISKEQQKLIELQKEKILEQQKIIEQYKQQQLLFEQQQLKLQEAQLKIQEQQNQLKILEENDIPMDTEEKIIDDNNINNNNNNENVLRAKSKSKSKNKNKINSNQISNKKKSSKSSPKKQENKIININKPQLEFNQNIQKIQNIQNIQNQKQIKEYIINRQIQQQELQQQEQNESEKIEYSDNILQPINPNKIPIPNQNFLKNEEENNLQENSDYEEVEEFEGNNEKNNKQMHYLQSQKFKIETYEPIEHEEEEDSDNDDDNDEDYNNNYINKNRDRYKRKERNNEPKDTKKSNSKEKYYDDRKKEKGPRDSVVKKNENYQIRGSFERKAGKKEELMENQSYGPRDSRRSEKLKSEEKLRNNSEENLNEDEEEEEDDDDEYDDEIEEESMNSNEDIEYLKNHKKTISISGEKSKDIRNKNKIGIQQNISNQTDYNIQFNQPNINYINNEIMPIIQKQFGEIPHNQTFPSVEELKKSPRFNIIYESQSQPIYNDENNIFQNFQSFQNSENVGSYYNEINSSLSGGPLLYENMDMFNNGNIYQQNQNTFGYEIQGNDLNNYMKF